VSGNQFLAQHPVFLSIGGRIVDLGGIVSQCFCDNSINPSASLSTSCNYTCEDDASETCGGNNT